MERPVALPAEAHEGAVSVAVTGEFATAALLTDSMLRVVLRVALPAVASNLLMTLFVSVDAFWVGTRIGATGLAAVSTSIFWVWMVVSIGEMVGVGLTAVAARRHGERRPEAAARVAGDTILLALLLGLAVALVGLSKVGAMFALMHAPPDVAAMGHSYLGTYLFGAPLVFGYFAVDATFRASGDTRTPFWLLAVSVAMSLVLDPILILGLWGAPQLGVAGAALATVLTRSVAFLAGVWILARRRMIGGLRNADFGSTAQFNPKSAIRNRAGPLISVMRIGLPTAVTGSIFSLIYVFLTRSTTRFGVPALAALGLGHRVESWLFTIGIGFGAAAAAIIGQNLGAGHLDRAERAGWISVAFASAPGFIGAILVLTIPRHLAGIFTSDPAVIAEAARYLRIGALSNLFIGAEIVLEGALAGAGATAQPMLTSTTLTAARVPLAAWAATRWGIVGIWWVISITAACRGLAMMGLWGWGRWKKVRA